MDSTAAEKGSESRYVVCKAHELGAGQIKPYRVGGRRLAVMRLDDDSLRAMSDTCPHEGASLSQGKLERMWDADDTGGYRCNDAHVVVCPWHNFEFDTETGRAYAPERLRVKTYRVENEGDDIAVYL